MAGYATVFETATDRWFDKKLTSQIAFNSPEWYKLYAKADTRAAGRKAVWEPRYARRTLSAIGRYGSYDATPLEHYREAELPIVRYIMGGMLDEGDIGQNTGRAKIIELVGEELAGLKDDVIYGMCGKLWTGTGGDLELQGLYSSGGPIYSAAGTYAGIAQGTYTWFDTNRKALSGVELTLDNIEEEILASSHGTDTVDLLVAGKAIWRKVFNLAVTHHRLVTPVTGAGKNLASLGFETIEVCGKPLVWSDHCPNYGSSTGSLGTLFGLNTKDIRMSFVSGYKMKRTPWKNLERQPNTIACYMQNHLVVMVKAPRNHFVIYGAKEN